MNYMDKLKQEFKLAMNIDNEEFFQTWLQYKNVHLSRYIELLLYLGLDLNNTPVELDKGIYDSIGLVIPDNQNIIEITNYTNGMDKNNIIKCEGDLVISNGKIRVKKNNIFSCIDFSNSNVFLTQLPTVTDTMINLKLLKFLNKEIYLGTYGHINDIDIADKINSLLEFKKELAQSGIDCKDESTTMYDTYMYALTPRRIK